MSVSSTTYIGPYIKVYNPITQDIKIYNGCKMPKCVNYNKHVVSKFCPECGQGTSNVSVPTTTRVQFDVYEAFDDNLCEVFGEYKPDELKDYLIFHSNIKGFGASFESSNDTFLFNISRADINTVVFKFIAKFKNEIAKLHKIFGSDNVEIKYGVLNNIS